ncbi:MAG: hypothetical protein IT376_21245 [Polyangiaceae bacterium]|nr:hypothetical protein [Polyangiaceae bacterium]
MRRLALAGALVIGASACAIEGAQPSGGPGPTARETASGAASGASPDRLAPGELAASGQDAFGLPIPRGMTVERRFPDAVHAVGSVEAEAVANFVRARVSTTHVEAGAARTVFPRVSLGADSSRVYRIEVIRERGRTRLVVKDATPPPTTDGLTNEERWRRAGMQPGGAGVDPEQNR